MAELIGGKGLDLTRAFLKKVMGSGRDRRYNLFLPNMWDIAAIKDDFTGPSISTFLWTAGNNGGASAASPAISVGVKNGIITMVTGTAGDNTATSTLAGGRHFTGESNAIMTARVALSAVVTSVKVEIGFRSAITTNTDANEVVDVKATPTARAVDGAVWILDTDDNDYWEGVGIKNSVAATTVEAAISPTASTYEYLQVALVGTTVFYSRFDANGFLTYGPTAQVDAVTATTLLSPHITVEARNATSKSLFVDAIWVYQARTTTP